MWMGVSKQWVGAYVKSKLYPNSWLPGRRMGRRDSEGVGDEHVHTVIFKMDNQQGPAVQCRGLCSKLCGSLDERRVWGSTDTCICLAESLRCPPETITKLLTGYTPIQNKKLKKIAWIVKGWGLMLDEPFTVTTAGWTERVPRSSWDFQYLESSNLI